MNSPSRTLLIVGDLITLAGVTVFGFATHGTLGTAGTRILVTFLPLAVSWASIAPVVGAYDLDRVLDLRQVWRPFWAMVLVAPLAAWLRGVWLGAPIQLLFVPILGGVSALGILAWRMLYAVIARRSAFNPKN